MARNIKTGLGRRHSPMAQFDRLPRELRQWLATAALPWSATSALRHWQTALQQTGGDTDHARAHLSRLEANCIARDAAQIWGSLHPAAAPANSPLRPARRATQFRP